MPKTLTPANGERMFLRLPDGTRSRLTTLGISEGTDMTKVARRLLLLALDKEERARRRQERSR